MPGYAGRHYKLAGGISIFDDIEAGWATPSWEEVVERDPDIILILEYTGDDVAAKKEFLETNEFTKTCALSKKEKSSPYAAVICREVPEVQSL